MNKNLIILFITGLGVGLIIALIILMKQSSISRATQSVALEREMATPSLLSVKQGEYVQFNSRDGREHNLIQGKPDDSSANHHAALGVQSGIFKADEAWRVQFKEKGTYSFYDQFNPSIVVTVIAY